MIVHYVHLARHPQVFWLLTAVPVAAFSALVDAVRPARAPAGYACLSRPSHVCARFIAHHGP